MNSVMPHFTACCHLQIHVLTISVVYVYVCSHDCRCYQLLLCVMEQGSVDDITEENSSIFFVIVVHYFSLARA